MENEFHRSGFSFLSRGWIGLKNLQNFIKNYVFLVLHIHKDDPIALCLWNVVDSVNVNMRAKFQLMYMFSLCTYLEVRGKIR